MNLLYWTQLKKHPARASDCVATSGSKVSLRSIWLCCNERWRILRISAMPDWGRWCRSTMRRSKIWLNHWIKPASPKNWRSRRMLRRGHQLSLKQSLKLLSACRSVLSLQSIDFDLTVLLSRYIDVLLICCRCIKLVSVLESWCIHLLSMRSQCIHYDVFLFHWNGIFDANAG